jgi:hypothetical protein
MSFGSKIGSQKAVSMHMEVIERNMKVVKGNIGVRHSAKN